MNSNRTALRKLHVLFASAALLTTLIFVPATAQAEVPAELVGHYSCQQKGALYSVNLNADGGYLLVITGTGFVSENGKFDVAGGAITLTPRDAAARTYTLRRTAEGIEVSGGDLGADTLKLARTGGMPAPAAAPAPAAPAAPAPASPAAAPVAPARTGVHGLWSSKSEIMTVWLLLQHDGVYFYSMQIGKEAVNEIGRYELTADAITLQPAATPDVKPPARRIAYTLAGGTLNASGGNLPGDLKLSPVEAQAASLTERSLVGRWKVQNVGFTEVVLFLPDGRYWATGFGAGKTAQEMGTYAVKNGELILTRSSAEAGKSGGEDHCIAVQATPRTLYVGGSKIGSTPWKFSLIGGAPSPREDRQTLVGRWVYRNVGATITLTHNADGTYSAQAIVAGGKSMDEKGQWELRDNRICYKPQTGKAVERPYVVDGHRLVVQGEGLPEPIEFRSRPATDPRLLDALVGRWTCKEAGGATATYEILPGGRFRSRASIPGSATLEDEGELCADGNVLLLDSKTGERCERRFSQAADKLTLTDAAGDEAKLEFSLEPGSREKIAAEAAAAKAAAEKADADWREKIKIAPARSFKIIATAETPADPNPDRAFPLSVAFASVQLYQREWRNFASDYKTLEGPPPRSTTTWYFHPNGRFYNVDIHATVTPLANGHGRVSIRKTESWGKYRLVNARTGGGERVIAESDQGESIEMDLLHGRRTLKWDDTIYDNIQWALESLKGK